jgi:hypothetical protein
MRKLEIGSLPDRLEVSTLGDRVRVLFRAQTGEEIAADLSNVQATKIRDGITSALDAPAEAGGSN